MTANADALPAALRGTRPSTRLLYHALDADAWLSYADLQARTGLSHGSISRGSQRLVTLDVAEVRRNPAEPRAHQVRLRDSFAREDLRKE